MMCLVYSIGFIYAFAALGNLGLIYRERVMLLPFLMVLLAIPRTPKGRPAMYEWEYRRKDRPKFRAAMIQRDRMLRSAKLARVDSLAKGSSEPVAAPLPVGEPPPRSGAAVDVLEPGGGANGASPPPP